MFQVQYEQRRSKLVADSAPQAKVDTRKLSLLRQLGTSRTRADLKARLSAIPSGDALWSDQDFEARVDEIERGLR